MLPNVIFSELMTSGNDRTNAIIALGVSFYLRILFTHRGRSGGVKIHTHQKEFQQEKKLQLFYLLKMIVNSDRTVYYKLIFLMIPLYKILPLVAYNYPLDKMFINYYCTPPRINRN